MKRSICLHNQNEDSGREDNNTTTVLLNNNQMKISMCIANDDNTSSKQETIEPFHSDCESIKADLTERIISAPTVQVNVNSPEYRMNLNDTTRMNMLSQIKEEEEEEQYEYDFTEEESGTESSSA